VRVIITRPSREANKWAAALTDTGYDAVALPLVEVTTAPEPEQVEQAWNRLGDYDAAMFVSGNAAEHFFASNRAVVNVFSASSAIKTRAFATGPGTVAALLRAQAEADWIDAPGQDSQQFDSEALWAVVGSKVGPGFKVLIVRGAGALADAPIGQGQGRDWFANRVQTAGGSVDYVVAYQRVSVRLQGAEQALAIRAATDGSVWMFSSSEAISNLLASCPGQDWSQAKSVVTHPRIGDAARKAGFGTVCESRPSLASLLASIESLQ
jgi:uroporphyrinogen-III synthase